MKRALAVFAILCLACSSLAGFRVKLIKPKKPAQFQSSVKVGEITFAADLVIDTKEQKSYFYKELTPTHIVAVRLAIFNNGEREVVPPLVRMQLTDPSGREAALVAPNTVAEAVLKGLVVTPEGHDASSVGVAPILDPRLDPNDPRNQRLPPNTQPPYDPNDPRYGRNPDGTYRPYGPSINSGVSVILVPRSGGESGDLSGAEKSLVEKDFADKAHSLEPVRPGSTRDRFLYFAVTDKISSVKGFALHLQPAQGAGPEIVLKF